MVKALREKTGSPIGDAHRALVESGGHEPLAIEWLRQKGKATAAKVASRKTAEGLVRTKEKQAWELKNEGGRRHNFVDDTQPFFVFS